MVILGDFNWNVQVQSSVGLEYIQEIEAEFGLTQVIKCATRVGSNSVSTIDLILTNISNIYKVGCLIGTFSDHHPTFLVKKRAKQIIEKVEIKKRKMSRYDSEEFMDTFKNLDWSVLNLLQSVDEMWNMIHKAILYELNRKCPYAFVKIRKNRPKWFTSNLLEIARERDKLMKRYKKGGRKNKSIYEKAVIERQKFNSLVKNAKKDYFVEQLTVYGNDQVAFWGVINDLIGSKTPPSVERVYM